MRDVWLKSIRDAILAVFFLAAAALAIWTLMYAGLSAAVALPCFLLALVCLIFAAVCAVASLYQPWEEAGRLDWEEHQSAEAAWSSAVQDPLSKPKDSPDELMPRGVP